MGADLAAASDEGLLKATLRGDEEAFVEIYRRHRDRVYRFAYRMTGSPDAARDITHNCFASLLETPARYDGRASLGTYLCAAARHQSLRLASRIWRERPMPVAADRADGGPSPLDLLLEGERARIVREELQALAPLHREVLILVEYEELDLATVAEIVGAEVGTVKVRLHRARRKLRDSLQSLRCRGALTIG